MGNGASSDAVHPQLSIVGESPQQHRIVDPTHTNSNTSGPAMDVVPTDIPESQQPAFDVTFTERFQRELIRRAMQGSRGGQQQQQQQRGSGIGGFDARPYEGQAEHELSDEELFASEDMEDDTDLKLPSERQSERHSLFQRGYQSGQEAAYTELRPHFDDLARQQHEQERKWRESEAAREAAEQHQLNGMMQQLEQVRHRIPERELVCQPESARVIQCYRQQKQDPLKCRAIVSQYTACTQSHKHSTFEQLAHADSL